MSLTPLTRNFASATCRVFLDRDVFSGGASSSFALSKCYRVGDTKTLKRSRLPRSDNDYNNIKMLDLDLDPNFLFARSICRAPECVAEADVSGTDPPEQDIAVPLGVT